MEKDNKVEEFSDEANAKNILQSGIWNGRQNDFGKNNNHNSNDRCVYI